jgi:hypothetical protein
MAEIIFLSQNNCFLSVRKVPLPVLCRRFNQKNFRTCEADNCYTQNISGQDWQFRALHRPKSDNYGTASPYSTLY